MTSKKILIIDPDVASRNFIARSLLEHRYEVLQAGSGKEGLIYAWRDRPDLTIIDPNLPDLRGEEVAQKLRQDARTANMPLIALSSDSSVVRIKSCLDAGFIEYITKSGQAVQMLNDTIARLFGMAAVSEKKGGALVVFLSAKGGTGTSSLCANIAQNITRNQPEASVAVLDLVLPIGSIAPIVGYDGPLNIVTVTDMPPTQTTPEFFKHELPELRHWGFRLLAGAPDPESSNNLKVGRIWDIVLALKENHDFVFIDIGRSLSKITLPLIQQADIVGLVISTDTSTVGLTKTLWYYLKNKGVNLASVYRILNRAVGVEGLSKTDAENALGFPIQASLPYLSSNFAFANMHHTPYTLKFPKDSSSFIFQEMAKDIAELARKMRA